tara:strand:- start:213 stop:476 length:264 start_codon:yes stop_codon:yes gene_type:complete
MEDKDYLELLVAKVSKLEKSIDAMMKTMEEHKLEHGFGKMKDGGIDPSQQRQHNMNTNAPPGMGMPMDQGYNQPGMGAPPDSYMPPF